MTVDVTPVNSAGAPPVLWAGASIMANSVLRLERIRIPKGALSGRRGDYPNANLLLKKTKIVASRHDFWA